jgi:type I restriction enzyme, S subunit
MKKGETIKLPMGWEIKKLGEIATYFIGLTYSPKDVCENGMIVLRSSNVQNDNLDFSDILRVTKSVKENLIVQDGDILMCSRNGSKRLVGKIAIIKNLQEKMTFGTFMTIIRSQYNPYLFAFFKSDEFRNQINGGENPMINQITKYMLDDIEIPIPIVTEQQRIVQLLDETFENIDTLKANAEKNLQNAKELFESFLQNEFKDKLSGSKSEQLDSLCELIVDCEHKTAPTQETGYPSIRTPNIGKGDLILEGVNRVSLETYTKWTRRAIPQAGDLILAREAPAGNIAVIPENVEVCLGQRTVLIRPKKNKFIPKYLAQLILSKDVQKHLLSHSRGATVEHVNMKDIRAFKIYNLIPCNEQQTIVEHLDALSAHCKVLEANYQRTMAQCEEMKKAVLGKAFRGEL